MLKFKYKSTIFFQNFCLNCLLKALVLIILMHLNNTNATSHSIRPLVGTSKTSSFSSSTSSNNNMFINMIMSHQNRKSSNLNDELSMRNNVYSFVRKIVRNHDDLKTSINLSSNKVDGTVCSNHLMRADLQAKMRHLKSIISTCSNGYCRLGMNEEGKVFGAREFHLDTIWTRVDVSNEKLSTSKSLIGAFLIKFIQAEKYLCIGSNAELFASISPEFKGCLWYNQWPKLISANYANLNLALDSKTCQIKVLSTLNKQQQTFRPMNKNKTKSLQYQSIFSHRHQAKSVEIDECSSNLNVTSGFSPDMQKFFRYCQSVLLSTKSEIKSPIKLISNSNNLVAMMKPIIFANKHTKTTLSVKPTEFLTMAKNSLVDEIKFACKDNLIDEIIYYANKHQKNKNFVKYQINSNSIYLNKYGNKINKKCSEILNIAHLTPSTDQSANINKNLLKDFENVSHIAVENNLNANKNDRFKKCYMYRNKPSYTECMNKYYRCFKYSNDIEKLKICRKHHRIGTNQPQI